MVPAAARRRILATLFAAQGLFTAAVIAAFTLSGIIAADLSGSESTAGLPSTLTLVGRALLAFPAGWLMDRIGRRAGLSLGFLLGVAGGALSIVAILQGSFLGFLAGAVLLGGMRGFAEQGRYVAAEVHPVGERARVIGVVVFAGTLGAIGGPLLVDPSGQWVARWGWPTSAGPYLATLALLLLSFFAVVVWLRPDPLRLGQMVAPPATLENEDGATTGSWTVLWRNPTARLAVLALAVAQLVMFLLMVMTPLHMDHQQHSARAISWVIMAHTVGMYGLSGVTGRLVSSFGRLTVIVAGTGLLIAAAVMTPLVSGVPLLALSLFLLGLGWNFCFVGGSALLDDAVSGPERGRVQGASEMIVALASGVGSLGAGPLFARWGMTWLGGSGLLLALLLLAATLVTAGPRRWGLAQREV
jgi:MFS family permease